MGGKSCVVTGDMWQLPPVKDRYIFEQTSIDSRPNCASNHWKENFTIYYLTEKMRNQHDESFADLCDNIGKGILTKVNEELIKTLIRDSPNENNNILYQEKEIGIIVTTNVKLENINGDKVNLLLPEADSMHEIAPDKCKNLPASDLPPLPENLPYTKRGGLAKDLLLKVGAPIVITVNDRKYKEDGVTNGACGYVDSFQYHENNSNEVEYVWVVFNEKTVGKRLRQDTMFLRRKFKPSNAQALPIKRISVDFTYKDAKYRTTQFPMILRYAFTVHKSQGQTLNEVIIDFRPDAKED